MDSRAALQIESDRVISMNNKFRWTALMLQLLIACNASCSLIPIQTGRVDAVFNYTQTYELGSIRQVDPQGQCLGPRLLTAVLGERNYCCNHDAAEEYLSSLFLDRGQWTVN